jgi:hypothetical protein
MTPVDQQAQLHKGHIPKLPSHICDPQARPHRSLPLLLLLHPLLQQHLLQLLLLLRWQLLNLGSGLLLQLLLHLLLLLHGGLL